MNPENGAFDLTYDSVAAKTSTYSAARFYGALTAFNRSGHVDLTRRN